jgi:hypothetical protein
MVCKLSKQVESWDYLEVGIPALNISIVLAILTL